MLKIYTKTGDQGETSLLGGGRVTKDCITMQVAGELDELNATLGVVASVIARPKGSKQSQCSQRVASSSLSLLLAITKKIQCDLFKVGAEVVSGQIKNQKAKIKKQIVISEKEILELEKSIDEMSAQLPELRNFILPGGSEVSAQLHLARAICRRAERALVAFGQEQKIRAELYQYLNRLSDWLFIAARYVNFLIKISDIKV
ncbi:MAG: cob(I)yrinic acid a,c-diamide adenosyltransferase [Candidatus Magasanikbacteria bacterium]